jgi:hypothetical protein
MICPYPTRAENGGWEYEPYGVQAVLALDLPGGLLDALQQQLPTYIQQRVAATLSPAWNFEIKLATSAERAQVFEALQADFTAKPTALVSQHDKLLLLGVRSTGDRFELTAREYDAYVEHWSTPLHRQCPQLSSLPEQLFALMWRTFAPLAQFETEPEHPLSVTLRPRGGALPHADDAPTWAKPGDIFKPVLRRTSRGGELIENGAAAVAWTYIEVEAGKDAAPIFHVRSGSRRPFPTHKQARTEQLAIAVKGDAQPTTLYLHARKTEDKPLSGYDVYFLKNAKDPPTLLATSDAAGKVNIAPTDSPIEMLLIKHGSQLLAKLPIAASAEPLIKVPLPDDNARLAAEERLTALRENLIDIVVRRNIIISRAHQKIEKKDFAGAEALVRSLDELPDRNQFNLTLSTSAQSIRSEDPQIQRRIKQMFDATQTLATQFLDIKPINQLRDELREAQQKAAPKGDKT